MISFVLRLNIVTSLSFPIVKSFGFTGERLPDARIAFNEISYKERPYAFREKQNRLIKGRHFLERNSLIKRFLHRKDDIL